MLEGDFESNARARGYVLDDQGRLRKHMAIFIDGRQRRDRQDLTDAVAEDRSIPNVQDPHLLAQCGATQNRTRDGGNTFETLTRGLPQEHAYDLVFRHALDVDESGDRLAFGSTTGSLWFSEDAGDSWTTASSNLPPIYEGRFAKPVG